MSAVIERDAMLDAALDYASMGLAVVWLAPGTKRPLAKGWQVAPRATPEALEASYRPGMNIGLRTGPVSLIGDSGTECLCVLDLDISTDDETEQAAAWQAVRELVGYEIAEAPSVVSGSGRGRHWYLRWPVSEIRESDSARVVIAKSGNTVPGSGKQAWQLEILMAGAQAVANPSIHPDTGREYEMVGPAHVAPLGLIAAVRQANNRGKLAQVAGGSSSGGRSRAAPELAKFAAGLVPSASSSTALQATPEGEAAAQTAALMQELAGLSAFASVGVSDGVPDMQTMREALACVPPCLGRSEWTRVVWAVRAHGHPEAEAAAREWSEGCAEKWNPRDFAGVWQAQSRGPAVEAGTLYHIARQHGWAGKVRRQTQTAAPSLPAPVAGGQPATSHVSAADVGAAPAAAGALEAEPEGEGAELALGVVTLADGTIMPAGDLTNGTAFARMWHDRLLYISSAKRWMRWTGSRWASCTIEEVRECARHTAGALLLQAQQGWMANPNGQHEKAVFAAAAALVRNEQRLDAMISMGRSERGMWVGDPSVFDSDPWQLVCPNGVLDLRSGAVSAASPEMRISRQCLVPYEPAAQCPRFLKFLDEVFQGDQEVIAFVQRLLGYCLTGNVAEEKMFYWYGSGANGKSVLGDVVGRLLGDYTIQVSSALLKKDPKGGSASETHAARLAGVRLAQMNEIGEGEHWDDARLKELTSREEITAKELYAMPFTFRPTHKLIVRGNNKPVIRDTSDGTWRRMVLIGFNRVFQQHEREEALDEWLVQHEGAGILAWLVDGCLKWQREGMKLPAKVVSETAAYKADSDVFGQWLEECCDMSNHKATASKKSVRDSYARWCEENGIRHPLTTTAITRKLAERGYPTDAGRRLFRGISIKPYEHGPAG